MPDGFAIHSYITEPGTDRILVRHTFYGRNEAEAEKFREHHLAACEYFTAADDEDRVIEIDEEGVAMPVAAELREFGDVDEPDEEDNEPEETDDSNDDSDDDEGDE